MVNKFKHFNILCICTKLIGSGLGWLNNLDAFPYMFSKGSNLK